MSISREQIDQLAQTLKSEPVAASSGLTIQDHVDPDHLTVFQETKDGGIHQLLISITYIGKCYSYPGPAECKVSGLHLTSCDDDGYCKFCGHQA